MHIDISGGFTTFRAGDRVMPGSMDAILAILERHAGAYADNTNTAVETITDGDNKDFESYGVDGNPGEFRQTTVVKTNTTVTISVSGSDATGLKWFFILRPKS